MSVDCLHLTVLEAWLLGKKEQFWYGFMWALQSGARYQHTSFR